LHRRIGCVNARDFAQSGECSGCGCVSLKLGPGRRSKTAPKQRGYLTPRPQHQRVAFARHRRDLAAVCRTGRPGGVASNPRSKRAHRAQVLSTGSAAHRASPLRRALAARQYTRQFRLRRRADDIEDPYYDPLRLRQLVRGRRQSHQDRRTLQRKILCHGPRVYSDCRSCLIQVASQ
jgi:hypothetical protein